MTKSFFVVAFIFLLTGFTPPPDGPFKTDQLRFSRVRNAYKLNEAAVKKNLEAHGLSFDSFQMLLRAYKKEGKLEVFGRASSGDAYKLIHTYDFCMLSGELGPKRRQGDYQVPEGFYYIDRFNPASSFHLSLGINYPNSSDRRLGTSANLGGDIFIHGSCVSIGCIPITDEKIRELYIYTVQARDAGQRRIPVLIFPSKMNEAGMKALAGKAGGKHDAFWKNLKTGHDLFEKHKKVPDWKVGDNGHYSFTTP